MKPAHEDLDIFDPTCRRKLGSRGARRICLGYYRPTGRRVYATHEDQAPDFSRAWVERRCGCNRRSGAMAGCGHVIWTLEHTKLRYDPDRPQPMVGEGTMRWAAGKLAPLPPQLARRVMS